MGNISKKIKCPICDAEDNYLLDKRIIIFSHKVIFPMTYAKQT